MGFLAGIGASTDSIEANKPRQGAGRAMDTSHDGTETETERSELSHDALVQLPYPALLYFAACCARRVEPLFARLWDGAPADHTASLQRAIEAAERVATTPLVVGQERGFDEAQTASRQAAEAAMAADTAGAPLGAILAADAAAELFGALEGDCARRQAVRAAQRVARASAQALAAVESGLATAFHDSIAEDLAVLKLHATTERWGDEDAIPRVLAGRS
jgi:hypothetical protein